MNGCNYCRRQLQTTSTVVNFNCFLKLFFNVFLKLLTNYSKKRNCAIESTFSAKAKIVSKKYTIEFTLHFFAHKMRMLKSNIFGK